MYSIDNAYADYTDRLHRVHSRSAGIPRGYIRINGGEYWMMRKTDYTRNLTYIEVVVLDNDGNQYIAREVGTSFRLGAVAYEKALAKMQRALDDELDFIVFGRAV